MIPKVIHYCWFGGKSLPETALECIKSWKKFCPDYKIIEWNEKNFDVNENDYIHEAYQAKKYAFVSDYARLKVLYDHGGIYMDTDVEVLESLDKFLENSAFLGFENNKDVTTGIMACEKGHPFFKKLLNYYTGRHFIKKDGTLDTKTNVDIITKMSKEVGLKGNNKFQTVAGMTFYPHDFFSPKDYNTGKIFLTDNTVCIHHFEASWVSQEKKEWVKIKQRYIKKFGHLGIPLYWIYKYVFHPKEIYKKLVKTI